MNIVELTFSANLYSPTLDTAPDGREVRWPLHDDEVLCKYILGTTQAPEGALSIQESPIPEAGSGLFTTRNLEEGELIFTSVPIVLCGHVGQYAESCDFCFQQRRRVFHPVEDRLLTPGERLPPVYTCQGCKLYQYCSQSCWQRAWDTGHLYECGLLAGAATDVESRILYRLLILMRKQVLLPEQVRTLARLETAEAGFMERIQTPWPQRLAQEAKERTKSELSVADIVKLYCIIVNSSLPVDQTGRCAPLGSAVDLAASLLNHSCDPNIVIVFNNTKVEVRATRKLKAGEELLHCYRDIEYDFAFRNTRLVARYQFVCQCSRCREDSDRHYEIAQDDNGSLLPDILRTHAALSDMIEGIGRQRPKTSTRFDIEKQLANVERIAKDGYAGRRWPDDLEPLPMVLKSLAAICESQGDLVNCLKLRVRGMANTRYRKSLHWTEDLVDFVMSLSTFTTYPDHPVFRDRGLPKHKEFQDIFIGHLHALHAMLVKFYGEQARTTMIIGKYLESQINNYHGAAPTTRVFRRKFKTSQETILKWAGVNEKLWPVEQSVEQ